MVKHLFIKNGFSLFMSVQTSPNRFASNHVLWPVFIPAVTVIFLLVVGTLSNPQLAGEVFSQTLSLITVNFGWFYMLSVALFLIFMVSLAFTRWGNIKLGDDYSEPEYSFFAWFAMLFSAGYGIALLFFGVAEPVLHYAAPPVGTPETVEAAKQAMVISFFHWGFHIWAIYGLVGLSLAYFAFRHQLPLSIRSTLYPLIGERIYGPIGHTVDSFAILATIFGIATTLGLSVSQINAGMNYLWPAVPVGTTAQVITIAVITGLATISVVAGMEKGIKRLSLLNIVLAMALMLFVFIVGPTLFLLETFLENTGSYLSSIVERTFSLQAYTSSDWVGNWTLFIFAWTIAWAPFVGMFIAKISRGRTIREFVLGVMLVPTFFTFMWFTVFGDTALHMIMVQGYDELMHQVQADHTIALFMLFEHLPLSGLVSFIAVFLIITFFVTSADSGALVVDSLASGGQGNTQVWQRVFWALMLGLVASVLLIAGGLGALQTASIVSALPFAVIMLIAMIGMWRALLLETQRELSLVNAMQSGKPVQPRSWKKRLATLIRYPSRLEVETFVQQVVHPSMTQVEKELNQQGWPAEVYFDNRDFKSRIEVFKANEVEFIYEVRIRDYVLPGFAYPEIVQDEDKDQTHYYRADVFLRRGDQSYDVYGYEKEELISDILDHFERYLQYLHHTPDLMPWKTEQQLDQTLGSNKD